MDSTIKPEDFGAYGNDAGSAVITGVHKDAEVATSLEKCRRDSSQFTNNLVSILSTDDMPKNHDQTAISTAC